MTSQPKGFCQPTSPASLRLAALLSAHRPQAMLQIHAASRYGLFLVKEGN